MSKNCQKKLRVLKNGQKKNWNVNKLMGKIPGFEKWTEKIWNVKNYKVENSGNKKLTEKKIIISKGRKIGRKKMQNVEKLLGKNSGC